MLDRMVMSKGRLLQLTLASNALSQPAITQWQWKFDRIQASSQLGVSDNAKSNNTVQG